MSLTVSFYNVFFAILSSCTSLSLMLSPSYRSEKKKQNHSLFRLMCSSSPTHTNPHVYIRTDSFCTSFTIYHSHCFPPSTPSARLYLSQLVPAQHSTSHPQTFPNIPAPFQTSQSWQRSRSNILQLVSQQHTHTLHLQSLCQRSSTVCVCVVLFSLSVQSHNGAH